MEVLATQPNLCIFPVEITGMASMVYLARLRVGKARVNTVTKIRKLFDAAGFGQLIGAGELVPVKVHFGEQGNNT